MVIIRLARRGSKKRPFYQVIVTDKRHPRDGRFIEKLGFFNPIESNINVNLDLNLIRIEYWINQGAKISDRVLKLIKDFKNKLVNMKNDK